MTLSMQAMQRSALSMSVWLRHKLPYAVALALAAARAEAPAVDANLQPAAASHAEALKAPIALFQEQIVKALAARRGQTILDQQRAVAKQRGKKKGAAAPEEPSEKVPPPSVGSAGKRKRTCKWAAGSESLDRAPRARKAGGEEGATAVKVAEPADNGPPSSKQPVASCSACEGMPAHGPASSAGAADPSIACAMPGGVGDGPASSSGAADAGPGCAMPAGKRKRTCKWAAGSESLDRAPRARKAGCEEGATAVKVAEPADNEPPSSEQPVASGSACEGMPAHGPANSPGAAGASLGASVGAVVLPVGARRPPGAGHGLHSWTLHCPHDRQPQTANAPGRISVMPKKAAFYVKPAALDIIHALDGPQMLKPDKAGGVFLSWGEDVNKAWNMAQWAAGWGA